MTAAQNEIGALPVFLLLLLLSAAILLVFPEIVLVRSAVPVVASKMAQLSVSLNMFKRKTYLTRSCENALWIGSGTANASSCVWTSSLATLTSTSSCGGADLGCVTSTSASGRDSSTSSSLCHDPYCATCSLVSSRCSPRPRSHPEPSSAPPGRCSPVRRDSTVSGSL